MDCYQLVVAVMDKVFGKQIPDYNFAGTWKTADTGFLSHSDEFLKVNNPEPGDIVLLLIGGRPIHCGVVVKPESMLHSLRGSNSCIEKFTTTKWKNRIEGFYRWVN
ncbi:MAG: C40 family peptidase [Deltaproteobacteria bacterium]|nr:C40 family peptidase [Deltaproteobacteria bacterium]